MSKRAEIREAIERSRETGLTEGSRASLIFAADHLEKASNLIKKANPVSLYGGREGNEIEAWGIEARTWAKKLHNKFKHPGER